MKNQELVYERLKSNYSEILAANKSLGDRASVIVAGGTALATFFGAGKLFSSDQASLWFLVVSAIASLFVFVAASFVWVPFGGLIPGSFDVDDLWDTIIDQTEEVAMANMINDLIGVMRKEQSCNAWRAFSFRLMLIGVWVQVSFVIFAVWIGT